MRELLLEIWTSVRRNKLRTFLTGFSDLLVKTGAETPQKQENATL